MSQPQQKSGILTHRKESPTAFNATKRCQSSGAMDYRVLLAMQGGAQMSTVVEAATGDEAAEKALAKHPGWKVAYVGPATKDDIAAASAVSADAAVLA